MLLALFVGCTGAPDPSSNGTSVETASTRLHAEGTRIVDADGDTVVLRGVNLGAWMFHETWITAVDYPTWGRFHASAVARGHGDAASEALRELGETDDLDRLEAALAARIGAAAAAEVRADTDALPTVYDDSDLPLRTVLETRFGVAGRDALLDTFQGAWITRDDLVAIRDLGFNAVRVPTGYRGLTSGSDLAPVTELVWNEAAFARLDALFDACEELGLWAILDLQESPGGHNDYAGVGTLYEDPAMQALTVATWEELSRRYADRDAIAAYSLLAEPMSAPSMEASIAMYDQLYDAIRARGDDHLLVIHDGFKGLWNMPAPAEVGWTDVVYSTHLFEWGAASEADYAAIVALYDASYGPAQEAQQVPYFIGSFSTMEDADWAYASARGLVDWYESRGYSWAWWTWKRIDDPLATELWGTRTGWGLRREPWDGFERPDAWLDDEATLARKLSGYGGEMAENTALADAIAPARR